MKKNIDIYWFSGTGNTLLVVKKAAAVFQERGVATRLFKMEQADPARIDINHTIGLAFPVSVQSTYSLVWEFIGRLPSGRLIGVFMIDTLAGFSGGVVGPLRKILTKKGYRPLGAEEIRMPNNFLPGRIDPEKNERKREAGLKKSAKFARALLEGKARWGRVPILSDLIYHFSRSKRIRNYLSRKGSKFTVNPSACTHCGSCIELCPVGNITMKEFPVFSDGCQQCMRCISFCPTGAIIVPGKKYQVYRAVGIGGLRVKP
ncbi:MAG: EFR1 family ferrodoxin [Candidatus Auribacterota bacterium]|nr:EFR1 family ferrodoxin [Candidatus Auribacterota bacterium]